MTSLLNSGLRDDGVTCICIFEEFDGFLMTISYI